MNMRDNDRISHLSTLELVTLTDQFEKSLMTLLKMNYSLRYKMTQFMIFLVWRITMLIKTYKIQCNKYNGLR